MFYFLVIKPLNTTVQYRHELDGMLCSSGDKMSIVSYFICQVVSWFESSECSFILSEGTFHHYLFVLDVDSLIQTFPCAYYVMCCLGACCDDVTTVINSYQGGPLWAIVVPKQFLKNISDPSMTRNSFLFNNGTKQQEKLIIHGS